MESFEAEVVSVEETFRFDESVDWHQATQNQAISLGGWIGILVIKFSLRLALIRFRCRTQYLNKYAMHERPGSPEFKFFLSNQNFSSLPSLLCVKRWSAWGCLSNVLAHRLVIWTGVSSVGNIRPLSLFSKEVTTQDKAQPEHEVVGRILVETSRRFAPDAVCHFSTWCYQHNGWTAKLDQRWSKLVLKNPRSVSWTTRGHKGQRSTY